MHPEVSALYARNAAFKRTSRSDPVYLNTQDFLLIDTGNKLARWFVRIPIRKALAVFAPLRMNPKDVDEIPNFNVYDSKLLEKDGHFYFHLNVSKAVELNHSYRSVIGVDLGERYSAVAVPLADGCKKAPKFYGREVRSVRRHYAWLRRRLAERGLTKVIRRIRNKEQRIVRWHLHNISKKIVDEAKKNHSAIVLGDLTGIRNHVRGRRMNRIVSSMPYHALARMIEYKAKWEGVPVITANESYTSRRCHNCGGDGKRPYQGLFVCYACGHRYNADYNGAINIGKSAQRLLDHWSLSGAAGSRLISGEVNQ